MIGQEIRNCSIDPLGERQQPVLSPPDNSGRIEASFDCNPSITATVAELAELIEAESKAHKIVGQTDYKPQQALVEEMIGIATIVHAQRQATEALIGGPIPSIVQQEGMGGDGIVLFLRRDQRRLKREERRLREEEEGWLPLDAAEKVPIEFEEGIIIGQYLLFLLQYIPEKHRQVIDLIFFQGWTVDEVGEELGISRQRVSQLKARGIEMLGKLQRLDRIEFPLERVFLNKGWFKE